jgi:hypothetical protein
MKKVCATAGTAGVLMMYLIAAALDDRPQVMFVGLWPLSHVAAETAWHLVADLFGEGA